MADYEGRSLHRIPGTLAEMLDIDINRESLPEEVKRVDSAENILVLLIDGFGYQYWKKNYQNAEFFRKLGEEGNIESLESVYPSETAAAMTSFYTGRTPSQHGMIGWYAYLEDYEAYIHGLPFKTMDWIDADKEFEGLKVEDMIRSRSAFEEFAEAGINCYSILPKDIEGGKVSNHVLEGSEQIGYRSLADMSVKLRKTIEEAGEKNYFFVYIPLIDKISHHEGTETEEYRAQLSQISNALTENLLEKLDKKHAEDTAVVLTADHGFINTSPAENIDLFKIEELEEKMTEKSNGDKVLPFGGPRNTHIKVKEDEVERTKQLIEEETSCKVQTKKEALKKDMFGEEYFEGFEKRIGDLIINHEDKAVWYGDESDELELIGHHGGRSPQEMKIPLITARLKDLL